MVSYNQRETVSKLLMHQRLIPWTNQMRIRYLASKAVIVDNKENEALPQRVVDRGGN